MPRSKVNREPEINLRLDKSALARACAKLDRKSEQEIADEGLRGSGLTLGKIKIGYDPVEPLANDEWPESSR